VEVNPQQESVLWYFLCPENTKSFAKSSLAKFDASERARMSHSIGFSGSADRKLLLGSTKYDDKTSFALQGIK